MLNKATRNFSQMKGKLTAICNENWDKLEEGMIYDIEFDAEDVEDMRYVKVYRSNGRVLCYCACERFTLIGPGFQIPEAIINTMNLTYN